MLILLTELIGLCSLQPTQLHPPVEVDRLKDGQEHPGEEGRNPARVHVDGGQFQALSLKVSLHAKIRMKCGFVVLGDEAADVLAIALLSATSDGHGILTLELHDRAQDIKSHEHAVADIVDLRGPHARLYNNTERSVSPMMCIRAADDPNHDHREVKIAGSLAAL